MLNILLLNEATALAKALGLTDTDEVAAYRLSWALNWQLQYHFGRGGWRSDVHCTYLPKGAPIPAGGVVLHLVDQVDVAGALGYHDEDGNEVPYADVGVQTTLSDGGSVSEVASHEATELAADAHVNLSALTGDTKRLYALEVGDPVQGNAYDLFEPQGKTAGITVADFALPPYFDAQTKSERVDFRGVLSAPFTIAPQGYMSYIDTANFAAGWQQQFGAERTGPPPPDRDDRLRQRLQTAPTG